MSELKELGNLTEEELTSFNQARANANQILAQIGQLEVQKANLIGRLDLNEKNAQELLNQVKERFDLANDSKWRIQSDGVILLDEE
mgnify:CR=1 FL=1